MCRAFWRADALLRACTFMAVRSHMKAHTCGAAARQRCSAARWRSRACLQSAGGKTSHATLEGLVRGGAQRVAQHGRYRHRGGGVCVGGRGRQQDEQQKQRATDCPRSRVGRVRPRLRLCCLTELGIMRRASLRRRRGCVRGAARAAAWRVVSGALRRRRRCFASMTRVRASARVQRCHGRAARRGAQAQPQAAAGAQTAHVRARRRCSRHHAGSPARTPTAGKARLQASHQSRRARV